MRICDAAKHNATRHLQQLHTRIYRYTNYIAGLETKHVILGQFCIVLQ